MMLLLLLLLIGFHIGRASLKLIMQPRIALNF